jgi:hypothetical protein
MVMAKKTTTTRNASSGVMKTTMRTSKNGTEKVKETMLTGPNRGSTLITKRTPSTYKSKMVEKASGKKYGVDKMKVNKAGVVKKKARGY